MHGQTANTPTVSWYWAGVTRSNYSLTVNTGSSLVLGCVGKGAGLNRASLLAPAFVLTKGSAPTLTSTIAVAAAATPVQGAAFSLSSTGGTLLWDSVNGNTAGYDYILASATFTLTLGASPASGYAQFNIPSLSTSDAGLYYCTFYDASAAAVAAVGTTAGTYANSGFFSVTITTKSGSGSSKNAPRNKAFEYSIALLGASKMLF